MGITWNPGQYLRYANERERPFWELIERVPGPPPRRVIDLGCGPGNATAKLIHRWPDASVLGFDSSAQMIEQASQRARPPLLRFERRDIRDWHAPAASLDLILSNATLHWVPGHLQLFERWVHALSAKGTIAFQVPGNFQAPSHLLLAELAGSREWSAKLARVGGDLDLPAPEQYYERLAGLGMAVDLWETTYLHVLRGSDPVLEWLRGSTLRPYLDALQPADADAFLGSYATALRGAYPPRSSGETLFPFRRVFVVASRG